ncbi:unnamed protein product [Ostreobium quekettii]|uniref:Methyltransferase domain-containing protein n=1 Tax=Ostreobium quekettii TaxID=121088 RepID=A0A8S1J0M8_9CHLO|nr:unnamed protein product [Ostreobium quekettii]
MELLPNNFDEFRSVGYWDRFFKERRELPFEWYGEWGELKNVAMPFCTGKKILMAGCGNSELSSQMYDDGIHNITNIDFSKVVIREMLSKNVRSRPQMKWMVMDMTKMRFEDGAFDVLVDKGGLDALMGEDNSAAVSAGAAYTSEVSRVLDKGTGTYICITLGQRHVLRTLFGHFTSNWQLSLHQIPPPADMANSRLQPFVVICRRGGGDQNDEMPLIELAFERAQAVLGQNAEQVAGVFKMVDDDNSARQQGTSLAAGQGFDILHPGRRVVLSLPQGKGTDGSSHPMFLASVLDSTQNTGGEAMECAVFIVPQGKESEWLYSTPEGQWEVSSQCNAQRLVLVALAGGCQAADMHALQATLSPMVLDLAPTSVRFQPKKIPYMTAVEGIGRKAVRDKVESKLSGRIIVEDVELDDGRYLRRLVFVSNSSVIQSEVILSLKAPDNANTSSRPQRKKGLHTLPPTSALSVDHSHLPMNYHQAIVACLGLTGRALFKDRHRQGGVSGLPQALVVGLGGGGLPMFLGRHFNLDVEVVELDPVVVDVAQKWFGFENSNHMRATVGDGIQAVKQRSTLVQEQGPHYAVDLLVLDAGSLDVSAGISAPPLAFLEEDFLRAVKDVLSDDGILVVNCVARSSERRADVAKAIQGVFPELLEIDVEDDVNHVLCAGRPTCELLPDGGMRMQESRIAEIGQNLKGAARCPWGTDIDTESLLRSLQRISFS